MHAYSFPLPLFIRRDRGLFFYTAEESTCILCLQLRTIPLPLAALRVGDHESFFVEEEKSNLMLIATYSCHLSG